MKESENVGNTVEADGKSQARNGKEGTMTVAMDETEPALSVIDIVEMSS